MPTWETFLDPVRDQTKSMHEAREVGLTKCRQVTQISARAIRHMHRRQFEEAENLLAQGRSVADEARTALRAFGELYYAGYLHDCEKELVEAHCVRSIIHQAACPSQADLGVGVMAFLNGLGEAASECRRYAVDEMRKGSLDEAERILAEMETIYEELITFDFSDAMTGGLRRTCDALRPVIERTRQDLIATTQQRELVEELRRTRESLP